MQPPEFRCPLSEYDRTPNHSKTDDMKWLNLNPSVVTWGSRSLTRWRAKYDKLGISDWYFWPSSSYHTTSMTQWTCLREIHQRWTWQCDPHDPAPLIQEHPERNHQNSRSNSRRTLFFWIRSIIFSISAFVERYKCSNRDLRSGLTISDSRTNWKTV